ncbi:hypothetical protein A8139_05640 [Marinomonas primoryensis]|uniref:Uncharacterized protein n=1 Tax=Marinomonas primoryensis TaxID=178399 RepID=A0A2Z4PR43_9GAMM|nr:hypothetical protein [Marinomonas primoryensis]AWX99533.1 hypothetical protein A8139_05640 [Marinomonas primoryensis]
MTLKTTISCDGNGCCNEFDVDDPHHFSIERELEDWKQDPDNHEFHYCPTCWIKIEKEMEEEHNHD